MRIRRIPNTKSVSGPGPNGRPIGPVHPVKSNMAAEKTHTHRHRSGPSVLGWRRRWGHSVRRWRRWVTEIRRRRGCVSGYTARSGCSGFVSPSWRRRRRWCLCRSRRWRKYALSECSRAGRNGRGRIRKERLVVQPDTRCFQKGLPIDFRFRSGHGDPFAFANRST
jgi:hypothetical protein